MNPWGRALAALVFGSVFVVGSCAENDCATAGTCAAGPSDDTDGGGTVEGDAGRAYPEVPPPSGCDPAADPKDAPSCVDETYALFVDLNRGSDFGQGSKAVPLRTIGAAAKVDALAGRPRIYVCGTGPYEEAVRLPPNVSLVGGFDCTSWAHNGETTAIRPAQPGVALRLDDSSRGVVVSDLEVVAKAGEGAGASSVAVFLKSSKATLYRLLATAGAGANGVTPSAPTNHSATPPVGNETTGTTAAGAKTCACGKSGSSTGGKGGAVNGPGAAGNVEPARPGAQGTAGAGGATCT
ncbi:MAG: hypothetical protein KF764_06435, partial [Labilithrix sp.]|nr:hypothetical protein [Labilithrix sp.]